MRGADVPANESSAAGEDAADAPAIDDIHGETAGDADDAEPVFFVDVHGSEAVKGQARPRPPLFISIHPCRPEEQLISTP